MPLVLQYFVVVSFMLINANVDLRLVAVVRPSPHTVWFFSSWLHEYCDDSARILISCAIHHAGEDDSDPFSRCRYISYFVSIEIPVGNNVTKKFVVYAARTSGGKMANSTLTILDEHFNFEAQPIGGSVSAGPRACASATVAESIEL